MNINANFGLNQFPKQDPESHAKQYAKQNNLSLEEAREQLRKKYGDPIQKQPQAQNQHTHSNQNLFQNMNNQLYGMPVVFAVPLNLGFDWGSVGVEINTDHQQEASGNNNSVEIEPNPAMIQGEVGIIEKSTEENEITKMLSEIFSVENTTAKVRTVEEIKNILSEDEFEELMQTAGFNSKTPKSAIVAYYNSKNN